MCADHRQSEGREPDGRSLFCQNAFGALRQILFEQFGPRLASAVLMQTGYKCGERTWRRNPEHARGDDGSAILKMWDGIATVDAAEVEIDRSRRHLRVVGRWTDSYESSLQLAEDGIATAPVCHALLGYTSGWATAFLGSPALAIETRCRGRGDAACEFEIRPADAWNGDADHVILALGTTHDALVGELAARDSERAAISHVVTPIIEVWDEILCVPVVGTMDAARNSEMTDRVLQAVVTRQAAAVIIDVTGIELMDTKTTDHFMKMAKAVKLLGSEPILTGISAAIAETVTSIGVELGGILTLRSVGDALRVLLEDDRRTEVES